MRAWIFQDAKQVQAKGAAKASHYVGWFDPDGKRRCKSCGPGAQGKNAAFKLQRKIEAELLTGTYQSKRRTSWKTFREKYDRDKLDGMDPRSAEVERIALNHFERLIGPVRMEAITTDTIDTFVSKRRKEKGHRERSVANGTKPAKRPLSLATVNKELRYIRAALRVAHDWEYLTKVPKFKFLKPPKKLATFVSPEDFTALHTACESARLPSDIPNVSPHDWWQALLVTAYMTGWRISALLALRWSDVDLDKGMALSQAEDNKGRRDAKAPLHPLVVEHLRALEHSFDSHVFPWNQNRRTLWKQFHRIQAAAGVQRPDGTYFGFHDLRRGFATQNAPTMDLFQLQSLMQHKSLETTKLYVNMADQLKAAVDGLFVPDVTLTRAANH